MQAPSWSRVNTWRALPYLVGSLGVGAITVGIAIVLSHVTVPNLSVIYVLLVLWLGSRYGKAPAVVASLLAFAAYDYFFVPPVGAFTVAGPSQLLELILLLTVALVTGQLVASLKKARVEAEAAAADSGDLYDLATAVLRLPEVAAALDLLCKRAQRLPSIRSFSLLSIESGGPHAMAGDSLGSDELRQVSWAFKHRQAIGCSVRDGQVKLMLTQPTRGAQLLIQPLTSGAVVARVQAQEASRSELRMLAALIALGELLLERRRAILESERRMAIEASDNLKATILSSLSHELKSPIASLRAGMTALVSPRSGVSPQHRDILRGLDREALRLDRLVGDLLMMSRLEAGRPPAADPRSLPEILGGVLHRLRPLLSQFNIALAVPDDLPAVMVDELQVDQVITNLLENAADWTSPGGTIEVGASSRQSELAVWVNNEGPDIPYLELDRVFDKFWTKRQAGSGLGLAICRRIVEAHGGIIEVRKLRRGPCFTFTLPLAQVEIAKA